MLEPVHPPTRPRTPQPLERDIQAAIIEAFRLKHRITLWSIDAGQAGMRSGASKRLGCHSGIPQGFPDLLGLLPPHGRAIMIEVKRPGGRFRPMQKDFLEVQRLKGAIAFWADSVDSALAQFEEQVAA